MKLFGKVLLAALLLCVLIGQAQAATWVVPPGTTIAPVYKNSAVVQVPAPAVHGYYDPAQVASVAYYRPLVHALPASPVRVIVRDYVAPPAYYAPAYYAPAYYAAPTYYAPAYYAPNYYYAPAYAAPYPYAIIR
jgi:hypothetical protein